jgi:hypothetical protein
MRMRTIVYSTFGLLITGLCATCPAGAAEVPIEQSSEVNALPTAVLHTVLAQGAGPTVRGVLIEKGPAGEPLYEVEMRIKGLTKDIVVGADGTLLVNEQQMKLASLPPAVRVTIVKAAAKRKIRMVESVTKLGKLEFYEAHVVSGKTVSEIKVGLDGTLLPAE